ncbi:hypothetical protein [Bacillus massiliglaciei]|uniref:hypothetical protein n=1 Tax=Bacillus massiliglaciei TaxID=1816693 RepID=UPI000DA63380|nr:hypothetical protein [Bacillus massiliglaciei]
MDPFTFGLIATGTMGGALVAISLLEKSGVGINMEMLTIAMETAKYGGILWLLKEMSHLFL